MLKNIISFILVFSMLLCASLCLFSCDGGESNGGDETPSGGDSAGEKQEYTYVVNVVDENGFAVIGAKVTFNTSKNIPIFRTTDLEGKAEYTSSDASISATITEVPFGYEYADVNSVLTFGEDKTVSVTISALPPFVIYVVDQDDNPIEGVTVKMCTDTMCKETRTTDADGCVKYDYDEGAFRAQLGGTLPEGYTVEDINAYYDFKDGVATIKLTKVSE